MCQFQHTSGLKTMVKQMLEGVKVVGVNPGMANTKLVAMSQLNHVESIGLLYERITWHYTDGNIKFTDSWNERS